MIELALWLVVQIGTTAPVDIQDCEQDRIELLDQASQFNPLTAEIARSLSHHGSVALSEDYERFGTIDLFISDFGTIHSAPGYTSWRTKRGNRLTSVYCARAAREGAVAFRGGPVPDVYTRRPLATPLIAGSRNTFTTPILGGDGQFIGVWEREDGSTIIGVFEDGAEAIEAIATSRRPLAAVAGRKPLHGGPIWLQVVTKPSNGEPAYLADYSWLANIPAR